MYTIHHFYELNYNKPFSRTLTWYTADCIISYDIDDRNQSEEIRSIQPQLWTLRDLSLVSAISTAIVLTSRFWPLRKVRWRQHWKHI